MCHVIKNINENDFSAHYDESDQVEIPDEDEPQKVSIKLEPYGDESDSDLEQEEPVREDPIQ